MLIEYLKTDKFRNLSRIEFKPEPGLNILLGRNAQGKTNLIEAIYVLARTNSFRTSADHHLAGYEHDFFLVKAAYRLGERKVEAQVYYKREKGKEFLINNNKATAVHEDRLRVVLFTPDDLYLVKGNPAKRRNFIDLLLKELSPEYRYCYNQYVKILKKRNLLLKTGGPNDKSFSIINDIFIEYAAKLIIARINFVHLLDEQIYSMWQEMDYAESLKIRYALSFPIDSGKINLDVIGEAIRHQLSKQKKDEERRGMTLAGPHLDDLNIYLDERNARIFASQGQQRSIAISLKLAELNIIKKTTGFYPVFLIDEVLAELDDQRRQTMMKYISEGQFQSILTAVNINRTEMKKNSTYRVEKGVVSREE